MEKSFGNVKLSKGEVLLHVLGSLVVQSSDLVPIQILGSPASLEILLSSSPIAPLSSSSKEKGMVGTKRMAFPTYKNCHEMALSRLRRPSLLITPISFLLTFALPFFLGDVQIHKLDFVHCDHLGGQASEKVKDNRIKAMEAESKRVRVTALEDFKASE
uniref:Uncharacterized protein n=1 Tax=Fagus sylvatica TaxID=28930 RepID=A0A2N9HV23_FAGSY